MCKRNVASVLRTVLEILPHLRPNEQLSSMWSMLLREPLRHLLDCETQSDSRKVDTESVGKEPRGPTGVNAASHVTLSGSENEIPDDAATGNFSTMFRERLVPIIVELFSSCISVLNYLKRVCRCYPVNLPVESDCCTIMKHFVS